MNHREDEKRIDELLHRLGAESFAVPDDLAERTEALLAPGLERLRSRRRAVVLRLSLAAALSFPLVLALNAAGLWLLFTSLERFVPTAVALGATTAASAVLLLLLSLSYGSIPILASVGLQFREELS